MSKVGHGLGWVASVAAAVVTDIVFALPARAWGRLSGRHAISWSPRWPASTWVEVRRPVVGLATRSYGPRVGDGLIGPGGSWAARFRALGVILVLLLVADGVVGATSNRWLGRSASDAASFRLGPAQPPQPPGTVPSTGLDPRASSPAYADSPWAKAYFAEFRQQGYESLPYVYMGYRDRAGRYLNIVDNVRVSHQSASGPMIWFFGGSTVFGEGQRDNHTIPSDFARLAESDGHPVRVVNFGVQADSNFQSMLRLEQALATRRPRPDLVVFYDGANDISQHVSQPATDQPQLYKGVYAGGPSSPDAGDSLFDAWRRASVIARWLHPPPATASPLPAPAPVLVRQILAVYRRGLVLARAMSTDAGARFASFFQPAAIYDQIPLAAAVIRRLPAGTIDLSRVFDREPQSVYIDEVHTNERGAQLVAEAMWVRLRGTVAALGAGG